MTEAQVTPTQTIMGTILSIIPPEASITRVEYEGPRIALYTKNFRYIQEHADIISNIVNSVKRRVVVRTDKSIRKAEDEANQIISSSIPKEAEVATVFFDDATGEVTVEAKNPSILAPEAGFNTTDLVDKIGWRVRIKKAPHIQSQSLQNIQHVLKTASEEREEFYKDLGETIFRPKLSQDSQISILTLGGFRQVGRSSILVTTKESKILLDCGIHPNAKNPWDSYPRFDWADIDLNDLDAVVISHAHLDHSGYLPVLFKYGYRGPIYCTEPTLALMTLLHMDYVKIAAQEGKNVLYEMRDVRQMIQHTLPIPYSSVTDISPDVKLVLNNAGHILGSATIHLHIGEGVHNIVYTGDYKFAKTMLFDGTTWNYPRVETLITESTYGAKEDLMPPREEVEMNLVKSINETLSQGGKAMIPVPAVGRAQEIMLVLDQYMKNKQLTEAPIFMEGMISEATAIHVAYPEFLAKELRMQVASGGQNPFLSPYFTMIDHPSNRDEALREGPAIIMATSGMLEGGPIINYFEQLAPSDKNRLIFVSYQIAGTMGRRILDGAREVSIMSDDGKMKIVNIGCKVEKIDGFSGHSDYNQLIRFIGKLRPKLQQVIINHGERRKVENLANVVSRMFRIPTLMPDVEEAIRLY
ncbi:MAG: beta-CASP ribonuclease aCPSF1 [Thaumarchaeota archaeon]|nr:beta-CASP ribonuclease aCPSF1 [Nitrososphaerota archaeon]